MFFWEISFVYLNSLEMENGNDGNELIMFGTLNLRISFVKVSMCVCEAPGVYGAGNGVGLPLIGRDGPF